MPAVNLSPVGGAAAQFFTNSGNVLTGGKLNTYLAGTTTPATTYTTSAGNVARTNPIVLDAAGRVPSGGEIWLTQNVVYKFTLTDSSDVLIATYDNISGISGLTLPIDSSDVTYNPPFANGVATNVEAKLAQTISVKDFGAVGNGVANDTAAIQAAITASEGGSCFFPEGTYLITAAINLPSNIEIQLDPQAIVQSATTNISLFFAVSKTNIKIFGGKFKYTVAGATGLNGGINLNTCTQCIIDGVEFEGMQYSGVFLNESDYCTVTNCYVYDTLGTHPDAHDIGVYNDAWYNTIAYNRCFGSKSVGVFVQGPSVGKTPYRNKIIGNNINPKTGYGVMLYQVTPGNQQSIVQQNHIYGILGSDLGGASGNGIYVQSAGGCIVTENVLEDCCQNTTLGTNSPACISISFDIALGQTLEPVVVSNNKVSTNKYSGIVISTARATVTGNIVNYSDSTNGHGILGIDCANTAITGNFVSAPTNVARPGIALNVQSASGMANVTVTGNVVQGGNDAQIYTYKSGSGTTISGTFSGNTLTSTGAVCISMTLFNLNRATVSNNICGSTYIGMFLNDCSNVRGAGNVSRSGTTLRFLSGGTCSNVYFDDSNDFDTSDTAKISNGAAGVNLEQRLNSTPPGGSWQIGDRIAQSVPVVGSPKGWRCTVAGSPGTWVSEGNL